MMTFSKAIIDINRRENLIDFHYNIHDKHYGHFLPKIKIWYVFTINSCYRSTVHAL